MNGNNTQEYLSLANLSSLALVFFTITKFFWNFVLITYDTSTNFVGIKGYHTTEIEGKAKAYLQCGVIKLASSSFLSNIKLGLAVTPVLLINKKRALKSFTQLRTLYSLVTPKGKMVT
jgi:hypothetical protein